MSLPEDAATLTCNCGIKYEYCPEIRVVPKLVFEEIGKSRFEYPVRGDLIIGRRSGKGYVEIRSIKVDSVKGETRIRNPFISRDHCKITVKGQYDVLKKSGARNVVMKAKCFIEDLQTTWGTAVNGRLLRPDETRKLEPDAKVVLGPKSSMPLTFFYKEDV